FYGKRLKIHSTIDPDHPNAAGTAIVLNYDLVNTEQVKTHIVIPGRAICITIPHYANKTLTILGIYAPNENMTVNREFWEQLTDAWLKLNLPVVDMILGDYNVVEEPADRSNNRSDNQAAVEALVNFKSLFRVKDRWRATYPTDRKYTYTHHGPNNTITKSRLDRIYVSEGLQQSCRHWKITDDFIDLTDHNMVSVVINTPGTPYHGRRRYTMNLASLENPKLISEFVKIGHEMAEDQARSSGRTRTQGYNPQMFLQEFNEK
ncbi:DNase I-like protein, partial [Gymnopus androsaceus JB14]